MKWTFSRLYSISSIGGSHLKFDAFFALHDMLSTWETGGIFHENLKRVKDDHIIGTFIGTGPDLVTALVCHEMAHVFESIARQEYCYPTSILKYYGRTSTKTNIHHNDLWRTIYRELKTKFMPHATPIQIDSKIEMVKKVGKDSIDIFTRLVDSEVLIND